MLLFISQTNLFFFILQKGLGNAVYYNSASVIRYLLEKGTKPNINTPYNFPILLPIAAQGYTEIIKLYFEKGGNINVTDQYQRNALHYCVGKGKLETTKYLVSIGCDYKAKDKNGKTPLDLANEKHQNEVVKFLQEIDIMYVRNLFQILFLFFTV